MEYVVPSHMGGRFGVKQVQPGVFYHAQGSDYLVLRGVFW